MAHIKKSITIEAPLDKIYAFARDPEQWHTWMTGLSAPEKISGKGDKGTVVKHHYRMAGFDFALKSQVIEDRLTVKDALWKGEFDGPLAGEHTWTYVANGPMTEVSVDIEYTVPGKVLGRFADRLLIEKMQERAIEHAMDNLKLLCESEVTAGVTR